MTHEIQKPGGHPFADELPEHLLPAEMMMQQWLRNTSFTRDVANACEWGPFAYRNKQDRRSEREIFRSATLTVRQPSWSRAGV